MKKFTLLLVLAFEAALILPTGAFAQTDTSRTFSPPVFPSEKMEVIATLQTLFDGMRAGDSSMVRSVFHPGATSQTAFFNSSSQKNEIRDGSIDRFVEAVGTPHDEIWDEKIWGYTVKMDGALATVWAPYTFFLGGEMSHCGVNTFLLFKSEEDWKITNITDTRRQSDCQSEAGGAAKSIHALLDAWHRAAATADEDVFFGSMSEDAIYLGTDATERWGRDEMREWSKKYFERESAWDFTATKRHVYFSEDGQTAWFEEELDTWMGTCRGSGTVSLFAEGWKIRHYNLAVTVPNEVIEGFIELVKNAPKK